MGLAKDFFGLSRATAKRRGVCVSCREALKRRGAEPEVRQEIEELGLCKACLDELDGSPRSRRKMTGPAYGFPGPKYPLFEQAVNT